MEEIKKIVLQLAEELKEVKALTQSLKKSQTERLKESWIDGQDVSFALNIGPRSLQSLRTSGRLPFSQVQGKCYYRFSDLEALLESNYTRNKQSKSYD